MNEENQKHRISDDDLDSINEICAKIDRYPNWRDFVNDALDFFMTLWNDPSKTTVKVARMWKDFTPEMKNHTREISPDFFKMMESMQEDEHKQTLKKINSVNENSIDSEDEDGMTASQNDKFIKEKGGTADFGVEYTGYLAVQELKENMDMTKEYIFKNLQSNNFKKPKEYFDFDGYPLIWTFYSRLLPVKIIISVLADMIRESDEVLLEGMSVPLESLREKCYEVASDYSEIFREYESAKTIPRNKKISTGLPAISTERRQSKKVRDKIESSKERFLDQFIGKNRLAKNSKKKVFDGALNAMGLAYFTSKSSNGKISISLTRKGAELYHLTNPIIENDKYSTPISESERNFILKEIIPSFPLENVLVQKILNKINNATRNKELKDKQIQVSEIDQIFNDEIINWCSKNSDTVKKFHLQKITKATSGINILQRGIRVATMGRLAEMKSLKWMIDSQGKSYFLSTEK